MRDIRPSTGEGADATAAADAGSVPTGWIWAMVRLGADPVVAGGTGTGDGAAKGSVSRFDGSTWSPIGDEGDLDGTVYAMALFGDDLVIGGAFHDAGGVPAADYVALWDGAGWVALGSDESGDGAIDGVVTALLVVEDSLFATGALISETGGDKPAVIARWDGDTWSTMPVGTETQQQPVRPALGKPGPARHAAIARDGLVDQSARRWRRWCRSPCRGRRRMVTWHRRWLAIVGSLLFVLGMALPAAGQGAGNDAFPPVAGGGPPDWVTPGLRLSYYGETASIRTSYYTYVEDPNGEWEDPVTGKRYRRTEEGEMPEAASRAYTQSDVIAIDGEDVIMDTTMYSIDMGTGLLSVIPLWGGRFPGAAVDGAWVRPDLLATVASGGTAELRVLRGPYRLGDTTVDAVGFMSKAEGTYASTAFDSESGAQIAHTRRAKGPGSSVHGPLDDPEGNVVIAWVRLADVRQRDLPGMGGTLPDWVQPGLTLRYGGTTTVTNPLDPYGFQMSGSVEATVRFDDVARDWATFTSTTAVDYDGYVDTIVGTGATGVVGQYWYTPDALAGLEVGRVLDVDPITEARLTVDDLDASSVTLRTEMPGVTIVASYDLDSGAMTAMTVGQGYGTTELHLASVG